MAAPGLQEPATRALGTVDRERDSLAAHRDYPMVSLDYNPAGQLIRDPAVANKNEDIMAFKSRSLGQLTEPSYV
jgi:transposase